MNERVTIRLTRDDLLAIRRVQTYMMRQTDPGDMPGLGQAVRYAIRFTDQAIRQTTARSIQSEE